MMSDNFGFESPFRGENCIFNQLSADEMSVVNSNSTVSRFRKNEYIFKEGDVPVGMQYLKEGKVKMIKEGISGREQIIRMFTDNGLISYRSLIAGEPHNGTAIAIEDSEIVTIPPQVLYNILLKNHSFSLALLKDLALELGHSNLRTVSLTQKHIRGRLAESILFLKEKYGFENDGQTLKVYLSREDLASLSNMTASNAIRTLSTFAGEKIISMDGRKIKIIDLSKLEKVSKQG
jgi:CRP-like cAMP-binding protein